MINNVLLIIEEYLGIYKMQSKSIDVNLTISYSEKRDTLEIVFESAGEEGNMFEMIEQDEIGLTIIKGLTENIEYTRVQEKNKLSMFLKRG
jgi:polar amino acid transport system ATP-binding protein